MIFNLFTRSAHEIHKYFDTSNLRIKCSYLHSQWKKICKVVVSKFVKLSGELLTDLIFSLVVFVKKKKLRNFEFVFLIWSTSSYLQACLFDFKKNKVPVQVDNYEIVVRVFHISHNLPSLFKLWTDKTIHVNLCKKFRNPSQKE